MSPSALVYSNDNGTDGPGMRPFACLRCSRRKQKCDRMLPSCASCRAAACVCEASPKEDGVVVGQNQEPVRKGPAKILEERLALLEGMVAARSTNLEGDIGGALEAQQQQQPRLHREQTQPGPSSSSEATEVHDSGSGHRGSLDMSVQLLSLSAMAEPRSRKGEFLDELSLPRIISSVTETYGGDPETTSRMGLIWDGLAKYVRQSSGNDGSSTGRPLYFASSDATAFLDMYVRFVDCRFPRLPIEKARHGIQVISSYDDSLFGTTLAKQPAHIFMAYMVIAIAPLVSEDYPMAQGSFVSTHILTESLKILDKVFREEDGVDIIHCIHLLVVFSVHSCTAGSSWHLIGMAMKKCVALGYHKELPASTAADIDTIEGRRWAFWSCYFFDRLISSALGRPPSFSDVYITVALPGSLPLTPRDENYVHLFRYALLMSSIVTDRGRSPFSNHLGRLLDWKLRTPASSPPAASLPSQASCFDSAEHQYSLHNTLILRATIDQVNHLNDTHRDMLHVAAAQMEQIRVLRVVETCRNALESLNRRGMKLRPFLSWITGYSALSIAIVAIYCIHTAVRLHTPFNGSSSTDPRSISTAAPRATPAVASSSTSSAASEHLNRRELDHMVLEASQILMHAGRQFPRLAEYRRTVLLLREAIDGLRLAGCEASTPSVYSSGAGLRDFAVDIKPLYLRKIVHVIQQCGAGHSDG